MKRCILFSYVDSKPHYLVCVMNIDKLILEMFTEAQKARPGTTLQQKHSTSGDPVLPHIMTYDKATKINHVVFTYE